MSSATQNESDRMKQTLEKRRDAIQFAQFFRAYTEASEEVQAVIQEMTIICEDDEADEQDREAAIDTLVEALFPTNHEEQLGIEIDALCDVQPHSIKNGALKDLADEEATFAERLNAAMNATGIDQIELAARTGVGQPAISNMLARSCRPQRRTVRKLASALGLNPQDLWPNYVEPSGG